MVSARRPTDASPLGSARQYLRDRSSVLGVASLIAIAGASLGALAGLLELSIGPSIREAVGNKNDTTGLGIVTTLLSLVALGAALLLQRKPEAPRLVRLGAAVGLLVPAGICFTTVGALWFVPGPLLIVAGLLTLADVARRR